LDVVRVLLATVAASRLSLAIIAACRAASRSRLAASAWSRAACRSRLTSTARWAAYLARLLFSARRAAARSCLACSARTKEIQRCFVYELEPIADDDRCEIKCRSKVERLVHTKLQKYHRTFQCNCLKKTKGRKRCRIAVIA
jgi:hypothetical protein